jgi:hypothetical protein
MGEVGKIVPNSRVIYQWKLIASDSQPWEKITLVHMLFASEEKMKIVCLSFQIFLRVSLRIQFLNRRRKIRLRNGSVAAPFFNTATLRRVPDCARGASGNTDAGTNNSFDQRFGSESTDFRWSRSVRFSPNSNQEARFVRASPKWGISRNTCRGRIRTGLLGRDLHAQ